MKFNSKALDNWETLAKVSQQHKLDAKHIYTVLEVANLIPTQNDKTLTLKQFAKRLKLFIKVLSVGGWRTIVTDIEDKNERRN